MSEELKAWPQELEDAYALHFEKIHRRIVDDEGADVCCFNLGWFATRPSVSEEKIEEMAREIEDDANGHVACNWRDYEDGTENREELRSSIAAILRKHIGEVK